MSNYNNDNEKMELGIQQLLGLVPPNSKPAEPDCMHDSDGFEYQEDGMRKVILRCGKCGEFYEQ